MSNVRMSDKILPAFRKPWHAVKEGKHLYYVFKGGRNSSKSTHISVMLIYDLMKNPVNALCMRKVGETIEASIFEQLLWAIDFLGVNHLWKVNKSPLKLTYLLRGNSIMFRGADKPEKVKSIKSSRFPIARLWIEELSEFQTEDEVSTIVNSIVRSELSDGTYKIFYSYNPPKRKQSWVNKKFESHFVADNVYLHHSTYLDNPHVSSAFIEEAEEVKVRRPQKYEWEYLGKPIGSGVVPFDNLVFRTITNEEIQMFDNIRQGIDWGYGADPFAFVRWHYDKTRRRIYCMDEIYGVKLSNRFVAEEIKKRVYHTVRTVADSAEPKSVDELKIEYGIYIKGAEKGQGSVEYGEKWLDDLEEIVIDPKRTPNTAKEFEDIDYQTDKDGNIKNRLEDNANHTIDSTRYAFEDDMKQKTNVNVRFWE